ncbi:hypothetical protein B5F07_07795 [Lachnoclostridium sp. An169]|uniref:hypothetical protein n=1 Tax=Lachnoclostridium sp. An169 TaxID=1965569 RepID=UPI000B36D8D4|nr:hypothetical protein [Lachnoclostridium sp. An169]OUP84357.1 hypothetical protein B5F07_07795 [Lachnoclostridium sp. An169]
MNQMLYRLFESNKFIFFAIIIVGTFSFLLYPVRENEEGDTSFLWITPVSIWLLVENICKTLEISIPEIWSKIAVIVCFLFILVMIAHSIMCDRTIFSLFNILGNLTVMYAVPTIVYMAVIAALYFIGWAAIIVVGIPALIFAAALAEERVYD